jgi:ATP phosphoribosyltransferase
MLKLALPGGDLRGPTAAALAAAGLASPGYAEGSRSLRLDVDVDGRTDVVERVFREKDIPVQVALGNYDLAVCGEAWVQEFLARHPDEGLVRLRPLGFGRSRVMLAAPPATVERLGPIEDWPRWSGVRIATEFPFLAERLARTLRLPRARVLALWGAAEAYPPEDAEACLVAVADEADLARHGLAPVLTVAEGPAWLIASREALAGKDLSLLLSRLLSLAPVAAPASPAMPRPRRYLDAAPLDAAPREAVRLALPDGHAQPHTYRALCDAGISFEGYDEQTHVRRPRAGIEGLEVKVIRPQDMPARVAQGAFDLAVTGRDCLLDHQYAFPSTPVREVADLHRSRYMQAAVVAEDLPAETLAEAVRCWRAQGRGTIRVASEYPNLADHYARAAHLGRYTVIPVAGASEGFVPEDSEILIEGTETGRSLVANRLKVIDQITVSTICLIAREDWQLSAGAAVIGDLIARLRRVPAPV